ncbi:MAG TPA: nucleotidyltransferase family protein [Gammaproteobacteria bacterium]
MARATRRTDGLVCVILAAGGSSRLGAPKQLVRHRGRALVRRAADAAEAAGLPPVVVVGADALRVRALLARSHPRAVVVGNARWADGLATSLRRALTAVPRDARAVLFMLADQPLVDAGSLARLIEAWRRRPSQAAAARYAGRLGVPAIIPRRAWAELRALSGDVGARRLLERAPRVTEVDLPEAAFDVDTPEDLARLASGRHEGALAR